MSHGAAQEQEAYRVQRLAEQAASRAKRARAMSDHQAPALAQFWDKWRDTLLRDAALALMVGGILAFVSFAVETQRDERIAAREVRQNLAAELAVKDDLVRIYLVGQDLQGMVLTGRRMTDAKLSRANLSEADLSIAVLSGAQLRQTNLTGANLRGANLEGADLADADLTGADLTGANLTGAILTRANLSDAALDEADLSGVTWEPDQPPLWPTGFTVDPSTPDPLGP